MQHVYFYFDDSGVLHKNAQSDFFIYAGIVFTNCKSKDSAKRKYISVQKIIKNELGRFDEIKAFGLEDKHKNRLYKVMAKEESQALCVKIPHVQDRILCDKKSIHRYKDYILKRLIKEKIKDLIGKAKIDPNQDIHLHIFVDEQATASNGIYSLQQSVYEELKNGIHNFQYDRFFEPIFKAKVIVDVSFEDSSNNYLIQASDILANRIWHSYIENNSDLRKIPKHAHLLLP